MWNELTVSDKKLLNNLGIDIFNEDRNYWFIRTQDGAYYDDFMNDNYVGIEWNKISDLQYIKQASEEELKVEVAVNYPKIDKPGGVVSKLKMFVCDIKKDDIVLIPSKNSEWISIGTFIEDEAYIEEAEENFQEILDSLNSENQIPKEIRLKRRKVKWLKSVKKGDIDPYLYSIIYNHSAISDAQKYSIFIDRTLSKFYVKGDESYFTFKVNRKSNIPYRDITKFLYYNSKLIEEIGLSMNLSDDELDSLIVKINVQSKGPIQIKDKVKKVLPIGIVIMLLFGGEVSIDKEKGFSVSTGGIPALLEGLKLFKDNGEMDDEKSELEEYVKEILEDLLIKSSSDEDITKIYKEIEDGMKKLEIEIPKAQNL